MNFQVVLLSPPGYRHAGALAEIAETVVCGLRALGHAAPLVVNQFAPDATNILLGGHLLPEAMLDGLPAGTVFYNLEQVEPHLFEWAPQLRAAFSRFETWDYSRRNLDKLAELGIRGRFHLLPVGTVPEMSRIRPAPVQDIDVLFYGAVNEHRRLALKAIQDRGLKVAAVFGCYGAERDGLIARAKLVINLHKHQAQVFEVVRVSYLLANRKAVVTELTPDTEIDPDLRAAVAGAAYHQLAETCAGLIADDAGRAALEQRGFAAISARRESDYLRALLAER